jgi:hypothetical protein
MGSMPAIITMHRTMAMSLCVNFFMFLLLSDIFGFCLLSQWCPKPPPLPFPETLPGAAQKAASGSVPM